MTRLELIESLASRFPQLVKADADMAVDQILGAIRQTLVQGHRVEIQSLAEVTAEELVTLRERLHLSRPVFAGYLRTNPRTLENWEQGRAKPNAQASLLIRLVEKFPDTVDRLAAV